MEIVQGVRDIKNLNGEQKTALVKQTQDLHTELLGYEVLPSVRKKLHKTASYLLLCGMFDGTTYNNFNHSSTKKLRTIMTE